MIILDEDNAVVIVEDICPYCDTPLSGRIIRGLHESCYEEMLSECGNCDTVEDCQEG